MEETFLCSCCDQEFPLYACYEVGNQKFCPDCLEEETLLCSHCEERILPAQNAASDHAPLCVHCYDHHYLNCERCGNLIRQDDAQYLSTDSEEPYCYDCYLLERRDNVIHDYTYKPEPLFYGSGNRYFGIELEVDGGGERSSAAEEILSVANREEELIYCKHDGSLNDGFELVTHPLTLAFHQESMPWQAVLQKIRSLGYTSHQANTCGLHLHVSRAAFGTDAQEQDAVIARILYFFEKHWGELLKFSRRTAYQLDRWAARYGYKDHPKEILDHVKKSYAGRYTCINLNNEDTVEFRIFRGTLKYNTLIATLQMVNRICDVALFCSDEELKELSWTSFVSQLSKEDYPQLIAYLKERRIYINDEVICEEEL